MISVLVGVPCAGKSSLVENTYLKGRAWRESDGKVPYCLADGVAVLGRFSGTRRRRGTDRIPRQNLKAMAETVLGLWASPGITDVVLEGQRAVSRPMMDAILKAVPAQEVRIVWVRVPLAVSRERQAANGEGLSERQLKAEESKCRNFCRDYLGKVGGVFTVDTSNVADFSSATLGDVELVPYGSGNGSGMRDDFVALILTHGRCGNVVTLDSLKRCGYTGRTVLVVDNEDDQCEAYRERYGAENVVVFDKRETAKWTDAACVDTKRNVILYARNESFRIAEELGYKWFIELDDDYTQFLFRFIEDGKKLGSKNVTDLDGLFSSLVEFMEGVPSCWSIALSQGGDFIGGVQNGSYVKKQLSRKAMNSFVCSVDRPFKFLGKVNEDVNTYVVEGSRGALFFSVVRAMLTQRTTQKNKGGMADLYLEDGTYEKSMFTVMMAPSCVTVRPMGSTSFRMHHSIDWERAVPKIVPESCRKA